MSALHLSRGAADGGIGGLLRYRGHRGTIGVLGMLLVGTATATAPLGPPAVAAPAGERPNVIVIVTDDQPVGAESALRRSLRWLRRDGTSYPNAYVAIPQCCPSRATIMTGQYPHNHGVLDTTRALELDQGSTLQRYLHDEGYRTGFFGKYLNSWPVATDPPYFDRWAIHSKADYEDGRWNVNGDVREVNRYSTHFISAEARGFMAETETDDDQPWLMFVAPDAPHAPYVAERKYAHARVARWHPSPAVFENDPSVDPTLDDDKPAYLRKAHSSEERGRSVRREQLRTLMSVDDLILELRTALRRTGENRDTLIVFTSDNGFSWAEHEWIGKAVPYTASVHVPLIVRWPAAMGTAPTEDERLVSNVDIAPTILAITGVDDVDPATLDGRALTDTAWVREQLLIEFFRAQRGSVPEWASLRSATSQYVEYYEGGEALPAAREYYDLVGDPWQLVNLLAEPTLDSPPLATQAALSQRLQLARRCRGTAGPLACP